MPPRPIEDYQAGWVCALPEEMAAARAMLDESMGLYRVKISRIAIATF